MSECVSMCVRVIVRFETKVASGKDSNSGHALFLRDSRIMLWQRNNPSVSWISYVPGQHDRSLTTLPQTMQCSCYTSLTFGANSHIKTLHNYISVYIGIENSNRDYIIIYRILGIIGRDCLSNKITSLIQ